MLSTALTVGDVTYQLRYEHKQQQELKNNPRKSLFPDGKPPRFGTPLDITGFLGDTDIQIYLIELGLQWKESGAEKITFERAGAIRQEYLEQGDPDDGAKARALTELLADALSLNVMGASGKKLLERATEANREKKVEELAVIYEAKIRAEERASPGTNMKSEPLEQPSS